MLIITCTYCNKQFRSRPQSRGKRVKCPYCKKPVLVPGDPPDHGTKSEEFDPVEWQIDCEHVVMFLGNVLAGAGRSRAASAMIQMLRELPRSTDEIDNLFKKTLVVRNIEEALIRSASHRDTFAPLIRRVAAMTPTYRAMLEASIIGVILGHGMADDRR